MRAEILTVLSRNPKFQPLLLTPLDEDITAHLPRFIELLHPDGSRS